MTTSGNAPMVSARRHNAVLRLTFDNPPANTLSLELMTDLAERLEDARNDDGVRVVILAAAGKLFSAGHDLKQMSAHRSDADAGEAYFEQTFELCARLMQSIEAFPKPVIAEVDGIAAAAGCQLVASCDLAIASEAARFAVNGIDVGLFCSTPAVALTRNIARKFAMEMLLTGELIDAWRAREMGLVNRVVPRELIGEVVGNLADKIAEKSPLAVRLGKRAVYDQTGLGLADAYRLTSQVMIENMLASDAKQGISAFLSRRRS